MSRYFVSGYVSWFQTPKSRHPRALTPAVSADLQLQRRKWSDTMQSRLNFLTAAPSAVRAMSSLDAYVKRSSGLEPSLLELIRLRSSQINGCAYCIDMHTKDARANGETEQRLYTLSAWRDTPFFTERERAALLWTEHITLVSQEHVPDSVFELVRQHFSEEELVNLTLAAVTINGWNRFSIAFRAVPGEYEPANRGDLKKSESGAAVRSS
ncbi:MAG: TrbM/KikA/MpfK family conjugal transfer protein [Bryobacteraceae bacterium]